MRNGVTLMLVALGCVLLYAGIETPAFGDPQSPASTHVSKQYIERAYHDAHTPNIVTVMIADYRSFDTFEETVVVFTAGLACFLLLRRPKRSGDGDELSGRGSSQGSDR